METRIQLQHPAGKKAVSMEGEKYQLLRKLLLNQLKKRGEASHTELLDSVSTEISSNKTKFEGSVAWHLEWVKLDLEARGEIRRTGKAPLRFALK